LPSRLSSWMKNCDSRRKRRLVLRPRLSVKPNMSEVSSLLSPRKKKSIGVLAKRTKRRKQLRSQSLKLNLENLLRLLT
jgi:hypothetical protein